MPSTEDADQVLRGHIMPKACYPCAKRKVKCGSQRPCPTCVARGHPGICMVSPSKAPSQRVTQHRQLRRTRSSQTASPHSQSPQAALPNAASNPGAATLRTALQADARVEVTDPAADSYLGGIAAPSLLQDLPGTASNDLIRPALGLANSLSSYPFTWVHRVDEASDVLEYLTPTHADILKYSQFYQIVFAPFYPLIDEDEFEDTICFYLESTSDRAQKKSSNKPQGTRPHEMGRLGLLLAILARGSQLSDAPAVERARTSREYTRRAFHCTRLANFLGRPKPVAIKCLLVIANVLQNDGQADASWALLGTIARLAEGLGLHQQQTMGVVGPSNHNSEPNSLWSNIIWQDCILSLCFDRTPVNARSRAAPSQSGNFEFGYKDYMHALSAWARIVLEAPTSTRYDAATAREHLVSLNSITTRAILHIKETNACNTRQKRIEHHICRLHTSFAVSTACRPTLYLASREQDAGRSDDILQRAKQALMETIQAFLDLQTLTNLPMRTWSMIHAALSSAMLLEYFGLNLDDTEAQAVMSSFTQVLHQQCDTPAPDEGPEPVWLSSAQSRAFAALRNAVASRRQGLTRVSARPGALKPTQDNVEMMQTLYATETSMVTPLSGAGERLHSDEDSLLNNSFQVSISDIPMTELGMFDWSNWSPEAEGTAFPIDNYVDLPWMDV